MTALMHVYSDEDPERPMTRRYDTPAQDCAGVPIELDDLAEVNPTKRADDWWRRNSSENEQELANQLANGFPQPCGKLTEPVNLHRAFLDDRDLVAMDAILRDARRLVTGAAVPACVRAELASICCELARVLHCGPHLKAVS